MVTLDICVQNLISWTSCTVAEAVECVTSHPARLLGIEDKKGSLTPDHDADFVVLDDHGNVYQTWKFGHKVYDVDEPEFECPEIRDKEPHHRLAIKIMPLVDRFEIVVSPCPGVSTAVVGVESPTKITIHQIVDDDSGDHIS